MTVAPGKTATGNRFLFTGREYFSVVGLYNYRNRFYLPSLGRFLQADPIGFAGDPANLYRYCANNPANWSDPYGLDGDEDPPRNKVEGPSGNVVDATLGGIPYDDDPSQVITQDTGPGGTPQTQDMNVNYGNRTVGFGADPTTPLIDNFGLYPGGGSGGGGRGGVGRGGGGGLFSHPVPSTGVRAVGGSPLQQVNVQISASHVFSTPRGAQLQGMIDARGFGVNVWIISGRGRGVGPTPSDVYIDPTMRVNVITTMGSVLASLDRILAHELGHAITGIKDDGPGNMANVFANENPIMDALGEPRRTQYP